MIASRPPDDCKRLQIGGAATGVTAAPPTRRRRKGKPYSERQRQGQRTSTGGLAIDRDAKRFNSRISRYPGQTQGEEIRKAQKAAGEEATRRRKVRYDDLEAGRIERTAIRRPRKLGL